MEAIFIKIPYFFIKMVVSLISQILEEEKPVIRLILYNN